MNTDNDNGLPEENNILLEEYKILVDLLKHQHVRVEDYFKTFLTANSIFAGAVTVGKSPVVMNSPCVLIALCFSGIIISIVWFLVLERIALDTELRFYQLRSTERRLGHTTDGIFTSGYDFFFKREPWRSPDGKEILKFPKGIKGALRKFRVVRTGRVLPLLFICLYVVLIFMCID
jgi:hypothetical protein